MRAEPLERERGLRLGRLRREGLADTAQLEGRRPPVPREHSGEEVVLAERADERPVHASALAGARERREHVARQQAEVGGGDAHVRAGSVRGCHRCGRVSRVGSSNGLGSTPRSRRPVGGRLAPLRY